MNHLWGFGSLATMLGLLGAKGLSGSGPMTAAGMTVVGSETQPRMGAVSNIVAANSTVSASRAAEQGSSRPMNASGSMPSKQLTSKTVTITIDALTNRHPISTYV